MLSALLPVWLFACPDFYSRVTLSCSPVPRSDFNLSKLLEGARPESSLSTAGATNPIWLVSAGRAGQGWAAVALSGIVGWSGGAAADDARRCVTWSWHAQMPLLPPLT